jgi:hypothetical protein
MTGEVVDVNLLTLDQRREMFALMDRHFESVQRDTFDTDLAEKDRVILLSDPVTGALRGFSTQTLFQTCVDGRTVHVLFSGDTVMDHEHWGDSALARVWGRFALELMDDLAGQKAYWFLISKGYKTYRFLPLFFHEFYPRPEVTTPESARRVIDALASGRFGTAYDRAAGVVRAGPHKDRLRAGIADITVGRLRDPHVRYFVEQNSGHARGDELCCIAPLRRDNFTPAAYRVIGAASAVPGVRA